ncbi:dihydroneopterin aldolase [Nocardiopsis baichengensis]|uniref:dihydroneopterin aldolase n=1 Tax=Nocardiopsis baichengensis TaxID=280240 RepID=UPI0005953ADD|nr:dihydroneopterin aldolase [Nocardiopsis baichengensis]
MDTFEINGLRLRCVIGCSEHERKDRSDVVVDLHIHADMRVAGRSDQLIDTWNYRTPTKAIITALRDETRQWHTVEALATDIARIVVIDHCAPMVRVRVHKPGALRFADSVGVVIERTPADFAPAATASRIEEATR